MFICTVPTNVITYFRRPVYLANLQLTEKYTNKKKKQIHLVFSKHNKYSIWSNVRPSMLNNIADLPRFTFLQVCNFFNIYKFIIPSSAAFR